MFWQRMLFKNSVKVYVCVDENGNPIVNEEGYVAFRYKDADQVPVFHTVKSKLSPICNAQIRDDDDPNDLPSIHKIPNPQTCKMPDRTGKASNQDIPIPPKTIVVYTDGGASPNPGPAGSGILLLYEGHCLELWHYLGKSTNNIAELTAILLALQNIKNKTLPILLFSDSQYAIDILTNRKQAKKNLELIDQVKAEMAKCQQLTLLKVRAHVGIAHNEHVDKLVALARDTKQSGSRRSQIHSKSDKSDTSPE